MPDEARSTDPRVLDDLADRGKPPANRSALDRWVSQASQSTKGLESGRLSHLIATTVAVAVLQQAVDDSGRPLFLLKGGTYLQYRLPHGSRTTRDVDGLVRGDLEVFLAALDPVLAQDWGTVTLQRTAADQINVPGKLIKPRRFHLKLLIRGEVWRSVKVEISADEAGAGEVYEELIPARLHHFGLPTPDRLLGIAVQYQVAQKMHACTDPHDPPDTRNERARDLPDLLLLQRLIAAEGSPSMVDLCAACTAVFEARAAEAVALGAEPRQWPPVIVAHAGWDTDYAAAAAEAEVDETLNEAVAELNRWIEAIAGATEQTTTSASVPESVPGSDPETA